MKTNTLIIIGFLVAFSWLGYITFEMLPHEKRINLNGYEIIEKADGTEVVLTPKKEEIFKKAFDITD